MPRLIPDSHHRYGESPRGNGRALVSRKRTTFSADYKAEAVRMVIDESRPIARVAADLGIDEGTLGG